MSKAQHRLQEARRCIEEGLRQAEPRPVAVYLFGSRPRGEAWPRVGPTVVRPFYREDVGYIAYYAVREGYAL